jgi:hypothetical protein
MPNNYKYMIRILDGKEEYKGKEYNKVFEKYLYSTFKKLEGQYEEIKEIYKDKIIEVKERKKISGKLSNF